MKATTVDEENIVIVIQAKVQRDFDANNKSGLEGRWDDGGKIS